MVHQVVTRRRRLHNVDLALETTRNLARGQDAESIVGQDLVSEAKQANYADLILYGYCHRNRASTRPAAIRTGRGLERSAACCLGAGAWRIPGTGHMHRKTSPPCSEGPPEPGRR